MESQKYMDRQLSGNEGCSTSTGKRDYAAMTGAMKKPEPDTTAISVPSDSGKPRDPPVYSRPASVQEQLEAMDKLRRRLDARGHEMDKMAKSMSAAQKEFTKLQEQCMKVISENEMLQPFGAELDRVLREHVPQMGYGGDGHREVLERVAHLLPKATGSVARTWRVIQKLQEENDQLMSEMRRPNQEIIINYQWDSFDYIDRIGEYFTKVLRCHEAHEAEHGQAAGSLESKNGGDLKEAVRFAWREIRMLHHLLKRYTPDETSDEMFLEINELCSLCDDHPNYMYRQASR
ncbi:hypothetical protein F5B20DRAFT_584186 [Whalleya microplaca]|nr:hypothetical protein F5B20DRAFT_584186 [Whalleya microplaca]